MRLKLPPISFVVSSLGLSAHFLFSSFLILSPSLSCQWVGKFIHRGRKLSVLIGQFGDWSAIESRFPSPPLFGVLLREFPLSQHTKAPRLGWQCLAQRAEYERVKGEYTIMVPDT